MRQLTTRENKAVSLIIDEYIAATRINKPFASAHEGYAIILEELDELWDEIKKKEHRRKGSRMTEEAVQVGAMALRFLVDTCLLQAEEDNGVAHETS